MYPKLPPFSRCKQSCYVTFYRVVSKYLSRVPVNVLDKLSAPSTMNQPFEMFLSTGSLSLSNSIQARLISWGRDKINIPYFRLLKYPQRIQKCSEQHGNLTYKWMNASSLKLRYWSSFSPVQAKLSPEKPIETRVSLPSSEPQVYQGLSPEVPQDNQHSKKEMVCKIVPLWQPQMWLQVVSTWQLESLE